MYLQAGRLDRAREHFAYVAAVLGDHGADGEVKEETEKEGLPDPSGPESLADALRTHRALLAAAEGDWMRAAEELERVAVREPENVLVSSPLKVAISYTLKSLSLIMPYLWKHTACILHIPTKPV